MRNNIICWLAGLMLLFVSSSCDSDDIKNDSFYTFQGETAWSFLDKTENLSIFKNIVLDADYAPLLSLYGHYTVFAPTDSAFDVYFKERNIGYEDLTKEQKIDIVNDHVIKGRTTKYLSDTFREGALPLPNMNNRFLIISFTGYEEGKQVILVNKKSQVQGRDNEVHNGVVHVLGGVVEPTNNDFLTVLESMEGFSLFTEAFRLTNLSTLVQGIFDENYVDPHPGVDQVDVNGRVMAGVVHMNKYGYTLFAESDAVFKSNKIQNMNQLIAHASEIYGTEDMDDYTSRNNPLNKFVSYHLLDRQMPTNAFIYQGRNTASYAMNQRHEYYETMLDKRLIEIKAGNQINTLRTGEFIGVDEVASNIDVMNGYIHSITNVLVYDKDKMENDVLNKRLRIDAHAIPPQLTNNNIRFNTLGNSMTITPELCGEYFHFNEATKIILWASESWDVHQADEIVMMGWYDFTLRLPPVPPGTYEVRFGYTATWWRGIAQIFFDGEIAGIPVDLSIEGDMPAVGWIRDSETTDGGVENDKMMRNRGYMKYGKSIYNYGYQASGRDNKNDLRVIIGTYTFQNYDYHTLRIKNVDREDGEFQLDFIEYVPVSYLDEETID